MHVSLRWQNRIVTARFTVMQMGEKPAGWPTPLSDRAPPQKGEP